MTYIITLHGKAVETFTAPTAQIDSRFRDLRKAHGTAAVGLVAVGGRAA